MSSPDNLQAFLEGPCIEALRGAETPLVLYSADDKHEVLIMTFLAVSVLWKPNGEGEVRVVCKTEVRDPASAPVDVKEQEIYAGSLPAGARTLPPPRSGDAYVARIADAWRTSWQEAVDPDETGVALVDVLPTDILPTVPFFELLASYCAHGPAPARPSGLLGEAARKAIIARARFRTATAKEKKLLAGQQVIQAFDWSSRTFLLSAGALDDGGHIEAHASLWLTREDERPLLVFFVGWDGHDVLHDSLIDGDTSRAIGRALREAARKSAPAKRVQYVEGASGGEQDKCRMSLVEWLELDLIGDQSQLFDWRVQPDVFDVPVRSGILGRFLKQHVAGTKTDRDELVRLFGA